MRFRMGLTAVVVAGAGLARAGDACNEAVHVSASAGLVVPAGERDFTVYADASRVDLTLTPRHPHGLTSRSVRRLTASEPVTYRLDMVPGRAPATGRVHLRSVAIDLDVDSDNTSVPPSYRPQRDRTEDSLEDQPDATGRILTCSTGDADADGIPDYADHDAVSALPVLTLDVSRLGPALIEAQALVRFHYDASPPADVGFRTVRRGDVTRALALPPPAGRFRLWTVDGATGRNPASVLDGGHWVPPDTDVPLECLFPNGARMTEVFIEAVAPGPGRIAVECQPRAGSEAWTDAVRVTAVRLELLPDRNQDRIIDEADRLETVWRPVFRFWKNNDQDRGEGLFHRDRGWQADGDHLRSDGSGNAGDTAVNGLRDLLDFFPVRVDLGDAARLLNDVPFEIRLRHADNALNVMAVGVPVDAAGRHLVDAATARTLARQRVQRISSRGTPLPEAAAGGLEGGSGILLFEGRRDTAGPLVLDLVRTDRKTVLARMPLPLRLASPLAMMRWLNLQEGGRALPPDFQTDEPPNWPDAETNGRQVIFIQGFAGDDRSAAGHAAAVFKRLFWSGSRAALTAVRWTAVPPAGTGGGAADLEKNGALAGTAIRRLNAHSAPPAAWERTVLVTHGAGSILAQHWRTCPDAAPVAEVLTLEASVAGGAGTTSAEAGVSDRSVPASEREAAHRHGAYPQVHATYDDLVRRAGMREVHDGDAPEAASESGATPRAGEPAASADRQEMEPGPEPS